MMLDQVFAIDKGDGVSAWKVMIDGVVLPTEWTNEGAAAAGLEIEQRRKQKENPAREVVKPRCVDCQFFVANYARRSGQCRYNPPTVAPFRGAMTRFWPEVAETDWCGQFKLRNVETQSTSGGNTLSLRPRASCPG